MKQLKCITLGLFKNQLGDPEKATSPFFLFPYQTLHAEIKMLKSKDFVKIKYRKSWAQDQNDNRNAKGRHAHISSARALMYIHVDTRTVC